ncbi:MULTISPECIES: copper homeostasis protein CutC [unclassified Leeuwenhoekiella]|uniref:copper homeostasis protein CutC n=1 Tax=unclassified Leeuwenhoekiella TaxID=2615029 RepID=UPI000C47B693|nr:MULTISPECIES: copper homeostasis protein CutC [unclassified Leeuwenhoekiella]MAW94378.1 copper homeostasis protein [Leeuwenhoekiella sp.]MBA81055.1 copper homeostasis protein [Leeuwenhoekiella sp.]|tara:strand:+ start:11511 stop:12146 length:636 start_codon:yes stop_codon:yes gene_type:complete
MTSSYLKEACIESLEQALAAEAKGADRLELCAYLAFDGLTPAPDLIKKVIEQVKIPVRVIIRPRNGDFKYNEDEINHMQSGIDLCKKLGAEGVVFGALNPDDTLNLEAIEQLTKAAKPLKVVIHKAIDRTPDPVLALEQILEIEGVDTVLTSGGKSNAFDGAETLKAMLELAADKLEIMPAGKITQFNLQELHTKLGAKAYHGSRIVGELS